MISNLLKNTPPYAFAEIDAKVASLKKNSPIPPIDFGVGDPTSPVPSMVLERVGVAAREHATTGYPSYVGMPTYRAAAAEYLSRRFSVSLNPETEISSTIGSKEAVFHFPFAVVNPGNTVIIPTPGYPPFTAGVRFAGGVPYYVGLYEENDFLIDFESIPKDVADSAVMMWLNYPNSPTGRAAPLEYLERLHAWALSHNIVLASDEGCYIDLYFSDEPPHSLLEVSSKNVLAFYSLSKRNNMTGHRVGFVAGDAHIVDAFRQVKTNIDSGTPNFIQEGAVVALKDDTHIAEMRKEYAEKKDILLPALAAFGLPTPRIDATFYIWQRAQEGTGTTLAERFLEEDLALVVTPGAAITQNCMITGKNPGEDYVRFALVPTMEEVTQAAERLKGH